MYFREQYEMLSNFFPCIIRLDDGTICPDLETAYQAMKMADPRMRAVIANSFDAAQAKRLGKQLPMNPAWETQLNLAVPFGDKLWPTKAWIMWALLNQKYSQPAFRAMLASIPLDVPIIEHNDWHDNYWGSCTCPRCGDKGTNMLGKMLRAIKLEILKDDMADESLWAFLVTKMAPSTFQDEPFYEGEEDCEEVCACNVCGHSDENAISIMVTCIENDHFEIFCEHCKPSDYLRQLEIPRLKADKLYKAIQDLEASSDVTAPHPEHQITL